MRAHRKSQPVIVDPSIGLCRAGYFIAHFKPRCFEHFANRMEPSNDVPLEESGAPLFIAASAYGISAGSTFDQNICECLSCARAMTPAWVKSQPPFRLSLPKLCGQFGANRSGFKHLYQQGATSPRHLATHRRFKQPPRLVHKQALCHP